jgi:hypothetical protein
VENDDGEKSCHRPRWAWELLAFSGTFIGLGDGSKTSLGADFQDEGRVTNLVTGQANWPTVKAAESPLRSRCIVLTIWRWMDSESMGISSD